MSSHPEMSPMATYLSQLMPSEANRTTPTEAEQFLLFCSLFPVDFKLPIEDLVIYGMALKLFGNVHNISEGRRRVYGLIKIINHQLLPCYLNKLGLWEDKYGTQFVKVFSFARDLAKSIASKYQSVLVCHEIVNGNLPNSNWYEYFYGLSLVPERIDKHPTDFFDIFEGVKELRILSLDIPSMPNSLNALCNLRTLHLKTLKLEDISWGCLMNLEFLTISTPCLTDIPEEMGQLSNLRMLDLRKMSIAYIPPGLLSKMLNLKELYLPLSFQGWGLRANELDYDEWGEDDCNEKEGVGTINDRMERINASISDLASLSLDALEISIPDASFLPENSSMFDTIRSFQILVPNSLKYKPPGKFPFTNVLQLMGDAYDMKVSGICELMSRAEDLSVLKVRNLMTVMFQLFVCRFPRLQKMIVSECDDLEYVIDTTAKGNLPEDGSLFSNLETLHLSMLPNLKEVWHGRLVSSFENLSQISIRFCNKLKYVFPLSIVGGLTRLKSIEILDCTEMNGIFYQCKEDCTADVLYTIEELHLHSLPKLAGFLVHVDDKICGVYNGTDHSRTTKEIVASSMDRSICSLDINFKSFSTNEKTSRVNESCINDEAVIYPTPVSVSGGYSQENASHQFVSSQQDSFTVNKGLSGCTEKSVAFVSSKSAGKWMRDLKRLEITFCDALQVIFSFEENHFISRAFNSLIELKLVGLRNLVHIWFQVPPEMTAFQNLQLLVISKCHSLYVFSPCVAEHLVQLQKLHINQCERMEEVVMKENEEDSDDKIVFPRLQFLECEHIPDLKVFYSDAVELPLLECLKINQCNKMKCISYKSTRAPLLERILINGSLCASMGDLNTTMKRDARHCESPAAVDDDCSIINTHSLDEQDGSEPDELDDPDGTYSGESEDGSYELDGSEPELVGSPDKLDDPDGTYSNKYEDDSDEQDCFEPDELVGSPDELDDPDGTYSNKYEDDSDAFDGCDELNMLDETDFPDSITTLDMFACEVNGQGNEICIKEFSFADLEIATNNFSSEALIGRGGFGNVYKGWLEKRIFSPSIAGTSTPVAIKKLRSDSLQGFHEWQSEVYILERLSHPNLIKLVGYCREDREMLLVYEFMQRESLEDHLLKRNIGVEPLSWDLRLKIAIGAARGLAFFHALQLKVIHRDVKPSNILLDWNYNSRITDFGLASWRPSKGDSPKTTMNYNEKLSDFGSAGLVPSDSSYRTTNVKGTLGYLDPQYYRSNHVTRKSDVYSFGVVLLQLMTGLKAINNKRPVEQKNLVEWLRPISKQERELKEIMDSTIQGQYSAEAMLLIAELASKCTEPDLKRRPTMAQVLKKLQQIDGVK